MYLRNRFFEFMITNDLSFVLVFFMLCLDCLALTLKQVISLKEVNDSVPKPLFVVIAEYVFVSLALEQPQSFELVFFKQNASGLFEELNPSVYVNYVLHVCDSPFHLPSYFRLLPLRLESCRVQHVIHCLLNELSKRIIFGLFAFKVDRGKLHLEVGGVERLHEQKECENRLKDASDVRNSVQHFLIAPFVDIDMGRACHSDYRLGKIGETLSLLDGGLH